MPFDFKLGNIGVADAAKRQQARACRRGAASPAMLAAAASSNKVPYVAAGATTMQRLRGSCSP